MTYNPTAFTPYDKIVYEVLPDGTCSYCGQEVPLVEYPDGELFRSRCCPQCDDYNLEAYMDWLNGDGLYD